MWSCICLPLILDPMFKLIPWANICKIGLASPFSQPSFLLQHYLLKNASSSMGQTLLSHAEGCLLKNVRKYLRVFNPKASYPLEAELLTSRSFLSLEQIFSFQQNLFFTPTSFVNKSSFLKSRSVSARTGNSLLNLKSLMSHRSFCDSSSWGLTLFVAGRAYLFKQIYLEANYLSKAASFI